MTGTGDVPLLLIPGLMCTGELFAAQVAHFSTSREVLVANHRRHDTMAAIATDILDRAPAEFALAGLSMGGYLAFEILRQAPRRVAKLALMASNARADRPAQIAYRRLGIGMAQAMGVRAAQAFLMPQLIHQDALADRALVKRIMAMADGTGLRSFERQQHAIMTREDNRPFLSQIQCPTLIIVGEQDQMTPVKVAREMADGIKGSHLQIIAQCGHLSTMEQPGAVNAAMQAWLDG